MKRKSSTIDQSSNRVDQTSIRVEQQSYSRVEQQSSVLQIQPIAIAPAPTTNNVTDLLDGTEYFASSPGSNNHNNSISSQKRGADSRGDSDLLTYESPKKKPKLQQNAQRQSIEKSKSGTPDTNNNSVCHDFDYRFLTALDEQKNLLLRHILQLKDGDAQVFDEKQYYQKTNYKYRAALFTKVHYQILCHMYHHGVVHKTLQTKEKEEVQPLPLTVLEDLKSFWTERTTILTLKYNTHYMYKMWRRAEDHLSYSPETETADITIKIFEGKFQATENNFLLMTSKYVKMMQSINTEILKCLDELNALLRLSKSKQQQPEQQSDLPTQRGMAQEQDTALFFQSNEHLILLKQVVNLWIILYASLSSCCLL